MMISKHHAVPHDLHQSNGNIAIFRYKGKVIL